MSHVLSFSLSQYMGYHPYKSTALLLLLRNTVLVMRSNLLYSVLIVVIMFCLHALINIEQTYTVKHALSFLLNLMSTVVPLY